MKITVTCYSGHRADESPRSIQFDALTIQVKEIVDRWLSTDHRYFKILGDDHATYIIRQDTVSDEWELTYYKAVRERSEDEIV